MSEVERQGVLRVIATLGVLWAAITLLYSTNTVQQFVAPFWNTVGVGPEGQAILPLGCFVGARITAWVYDLEESLKRKVPSSALGVEFTLWGVFLTLLLVVGATLAALWLFIADYRGHWLTPEEMEEAPKFAFALAAIVGGWTFATLRRLQGS